MRTLLIICLLLFCPSMTLAGPLLDQAKTKVTEMTKAQEEILRQHIVYGPSIIDSYWVTVTVNGAFIASNITDFWTHSDNRRYVWAVDGKQWLHETGAISGAIERQWGPKGLAVFTVAHITGMLWLSDYLRQKLQNKPAWTRGLVHVVLSGGTAVSLHRTFANKSIRRTIIGDGAIINECLRWGTVESCQ
jgi:hypothetical protein